MALVDVATFAAREEIGKECRVGLAHLQRLTYALVQRRLVVLERQDIVSPGLNDLPCNLALATHRVDGDDGALELQGGQQFWNGRDLIGLVGRANLAEHHAQTRGVGRHQMDSALVAPVRAAHGLAVDGYYLIEQSGTQVADPADKASLELRYRRNHWSLASPQY
ncbi:hypothetical protein D3C81_1457260 [compost metagenome]